MNRKDILRMAMEAGLERVVWYHADLLDRFAALVATAEREACAKVCEDEAGAYDAFVCAAAIRKRGEVKP